MSEIVVKVSPGIDAEKLRKRIEALLPIASSDEFEKYNGVHRGIWVPKVTRRES